VLSNAFFFYKDLPFFLNILLSHISLLFILNIEALK